MTAAEDSIDSNNYSPTVSQLINYSSTTPLETRTIAAESSPLNTAMKKPLTVDDINVILRRNITRSSIPNDTEPTLTPSITENPPDETCFVPAPLNTNSERDAVAGRFAEVSRLDNPIVGWPTINRIPIDEFHVEGYIVRAFPALFPSGMADYNAPRPEQPTVAEYYGHLIKYKDGRFERDPRFRYFAMNTIYRWRALSCGRVFVKQNPGEARLTDEDIKRMGDAEQKVLLSKMTRFASNIRGTPQYWRSKRNELVHFIDQLGMPTVFFTLSAADFHWPDLQRLLPQDVNRAQALADNPSLVDWFTYHLMHSFVKFILMKHFPGVEFWFRVEWQARGSMHVHGLLTLENAPAVAALLNSQIDLTDTIAEFFNEYCHAWNPAYDENGNLQITLTAANPSAVRLSSITNYDNDYINLVNSCQRHTRCMPNYCLRKKKGSKTLECRFGFPKPLFQRTTVVRELADENSTEPSVRIEMKRNDPLLNIHNRTALQVVRANIDFQPIDSKAKLIGYILKYTTKTETRSQSLIELFKSLISLMGPTDDIRVLAQKLLTKTVGERDYSAQEVCHNIHQIPDVSCSRSFHHINVSGSRELENDDDALTIPNALDKYLSRPNNPAYNISLFDFNKQYYVQAGKVLPHRKNPVVVVHPWIPDDENHPRREEFCRNYLLLHKPMFSMTELRDGFPNYESAYEAFINSHGKQRNFSTDVHEAPDNVSDDEEDAQDDGEANAQDDGSNNEEFVPAHATEDWFLLCERQPEIIPRNPNAHDWLANDHGFNIDDMVSFIQRAKINDSLVDQDENNEILNIDTLNETQRRAFQLVKRYFENQNSLKEPLRLIVSGTAGTGKSYLIKCIKQLMGKRCRVLAPTGVAAHNINGETLHRCFRLGISLNDNTPAMSGDALMEAQTENAAIDLFIIDEMSMVGKKLFGMIDRRMRQLFPESATLPFGGKAVVLVGDFGQLNPVCDFPLYSVDGKSKLADVGGAMYTEFKEAVVLKSSMRQSKDKQFLEILGDIRNDQVTMSDYKTLSTRFDGSVSEADRSRFDNAIVIMPTVKQVAEYNLTKLHELSDLYPTVRIDAVHTGGADATKASTDEAGGLPRVIFLCKTARVMLTTNLWVEKGLCNGAMGTVIDIVYDQEGPPALPKFIVVQFDKYSGPSCIPGVPNCVPIIPIRRFWSSKTGLCSRQIIPLALSWAITVHKSQGLTLPYAVVDLSRPEFCPQLTFVSFSRVPSLNNLLLRTFPFSRLKKLYKGKRFLERYAEDVRLKQLYEASINGPDTTNTYHVSHNADPASFHQHSHQQAAPSPQPTSNMYPNLQLNADHVVRLTPQPCQITIQSRTCHDQHQQPTSTDIEPRDPSTNPQTVSSRRHHQLPQPAHVPLPRHAFLPLENKALKFCYSNAVVQCLLNVPCLLPTTNAIDNLAALELGNLIHYSHVPVASRTIFSTLSLRTEIDQFLGLQTYTALVQRDAVDFANDLIHCLSANFQSRFLIQRRQKSVCRTCGTTTTSETSDLFGIDHIFIPETSGQFITLNSLLLNITSDRNQCSHCGCSRVHQVSNIYTVGDETECLIINIPLFLGETSRLNYEVLPFECESLQFGNVSWRLNGCVLHSGYSIRSGHYTSYSKSGDNWLHISDDQLIGTSTFLPSLKGGQIMIYVRQENSD